MKISARLVALVIFGFTVTLAVAGVAVFSISRLGGELGNVADRELPLVRALTSVTVRQLEMETNLERALRANKVLGSGFQFQAREFEKATARFTELAGGTQDDLRTAEDFVQKALRSSDDDLGRAVLRQVLLQTREIRDLLASHAGLAQRTFSLIENDNQKGASANLLELENQRVQLTEKISTLIFRVEDFARESAQLVLRQQQTNLLIMIAVSGIGLIACLALGLIVGRSISTPIRSVTGALAELVRGNTETTLNFKPDRSELGAMAVALRAFREEIINRRETVIALAESERRFHALAALSPVGVFSTDAKGSCHYINEMGCRITGLTATEALGRGWTRALHPEDRDRVLAHWARSAAASEPFRAEYRFVKPDGAVTWVIGQASQNKDAAGSTTGFVGTITDITEQKKAEQTLIEYAHSRTELHQIASDLNLSFEEKMQRLLNLGTKTFHLPMGIVSHIEKDIYTLEHVVGPEGATPAPGTTFSLGETYCVHALDAHGPVGFDRAGESRIRTHPCYSKFGLEAYIGCPIVVDGERYGTLNFSGPDPCPRPFADGDYSLMQLFSQWIGTEISRQRAENVLRVSEERLKLALEGTEDGLWDWNVVTGQVYFSPRWEDMLGFEPGQMERHISAWEKRIHPDDRAAMRKALDGHLQGTSLIYESEHRVKTKDGTWIWILDRGKVVDRAPDGKPVRAVGAHTDITARKRAEDALRESEERVRTLVENIVDGIVTIDPAGIIETVNPAVERIFGYESAEMLGKNIKMLMPQPHRDSHDEYLKRYRDTGDGHIIGTGREVEGRRKDGTIFPIDLAINEMVVGERRVFTGILRDITERRQVERLKNEFVSSVSHELRTPLTSIRGSLGLIVGGAVGDLNEKAQELVDIAFNNSQRLINIVNDILDLEKIGSGQLKFRFRRADLVALARNAVAENEGFATEYGVRFRMAQGQESALVRADSDRINQVMANLLSNAAKFSPDGETVDIKVDKTDGWVRVSVQDRGPGIPEEFRDRLFDRFSQADSSDTRKAGGTGLGLSIVKAIVEHHGGHVGFDSEMGVGSVFYFELPAIKPDERQETSTAPEPRSSKGHVLICEDDPDVAKLLKVLLDQAGISSDIAPDGLAARALLSKHHYDAATVDLVLPEEDGISLIRSIRENDRTRDLPVVVVSARAEEARNGVGASTLDIVDWLNKPIDEQRLLRAIGMAKSSGSRRKARILYVEDDPDLVEVVAALVSGSADATIAASLGEAREALRGNSYDLVILDVGLPDGSGLDLLPVLENEDGQPTPVIVFSGNEIEEDMIQRVDAALIKAKTSNKVLLNTIHRLIGPRAQDGRNRGNPE